MKIKMRIAGFTLIELMIVVILIAIIAKIAVAAYTAFETEAVRTDGIDGILAISLAEEKYRTSNTLYGTLAQAYGGTSTSPQGYYTLSVTNVSATAYTITAVLVKGTDLQGVTSCTTLTYAVSNGTITKTPAVCWPS